jgi:hypothetical protein
MGLPGGAAGAPHLNLVILRVNTFPHGELLGGSGKTSL